MDLRKSLKLVRERKLLFLLASLIAFGFLTLRPSVQPGPSRYVSHAKLLLAPRAQAPASEHSDGLQTWFASEVLLRELLTSEELLQRVIRRLGVKESWQQMRAQISLNPLDSSTGKISLLEVSVSSSSPEDSQRKTSALVAEFIVYTQELSAAEFASSRQFLEDLASQARSELNKAQKAILVWREKHGAASLDQATSGRAERELQLENQATDFQAQLAVLQAEVEALQKFLSGASGVPPWSVLEKNDSVAELQRTVSENQARLQQLLRAYQPESVRVVAARAQLQQAQASYQAELGQLAHSMLVEKQARAQGTQQSLLTLRRQLGELRSHQDVASQLEWANLQRKLEVWEKTFSDLTAQLYSARVAEQTSRRQGSLTVLEKAEPGSMETVVVQKPRDKQLLLALPMALLCGLGAVLLANQLGASLKLRPRVTETLDLPILGELPPLPDSIVSRWERGTSSAERSETGLKGK